jgi:hypothetical protein
MRRNHQRSGGACTPRRRYLNRDAFASDEQDDPYGSALLARREDSELAVEVREALAAGQQFLLVHENDPHYRSCEFAYFFQVTPQDLVSAGLYRSMAVPWYPGLYRAASTKLALASLATNALEVDGTGGTQIISCEHVRIADVPPSKPPARRVVRLHFSPLAGRRMLPDRTLLKQDGAELQTHC